MKHFSFFILVLIMSSCGKDRAAPQLSTCDTDCPKVIYTNTTNGTGDNYDIIGAFKDGDKLKVKVQYGGGCAEHCFWLYEEAKVTLTKAHLTLRHDGNGDMCKALITRELCFDISNIKARKLVLNGEELEPK